MVLLGGFVVLCAPPAWRYQQAAPVFFMDAAFFTRHTTDPGGLLQYAAAALAQLNVSNWLGGLAYTGLLAAGLFAATRVLRAANRALAPAGACALVAILAALPGRFGPGVEQTTLAVLITLLAVLAWKQVPPARTVWRAMVAWLMAAALCYVAGAVPVVMFALLALLLEIARGGRATSIAACAASVLVVPLWAAWHRGFAPLAAVEAWGSGLTLGLHVAAFAWTPLWLALGLVLGRRLPQIGVARRPLLAWAAGGGAALVFVWSSVDTAQRARVRFETLVARQDWNAALQVAAGVKPWTAAARVDLTRALFHAGRLPGDLFTVPQSRGRDLLPDREPGVDLHRALAVTLFELGQVNLAEHRAHEALELEGARPDTLALLARINVLKGRPKAARVFLNRLRRVPFHAGEADLALRALEADPTGAGDRSLGEIRLRLPRTDDPDSRLPAEPLLAQLLAANPTNAMAAAYLAAHRLLGSQLELLPPLAPALKAANGGRLPRACEEALVLLAGQTKGSVGAAVESAISPATRERYRRFAEIAGRHAAQPEAARAALAAEFGDTFWFYQLFGETAPPAAPASGS